MCCSAQYKFANGDSYEGDYVRGRKEGKGTYKSIVGAVYKGEYKADRREGQGCEWYANGNEYEGGFDAGKRSGHGTVTLVTTFTPVGGAALSATRTVTLAKVR